MTRGKPDESLCWSAVSHFSGLAGDLSRMTNPLFTNMLRSYFTTALRQLLWQKGYSLLNLTGLAVGLTCLLLITLYVQDELAYDRFHAKSDRIYRVTREFLDEDGTPVLHLGFVAAPFAPRLRQAFSEIERIVRLFPSGGKLTRGADTFEEGNLYYADPDVFEVFSFQFHGGNARNVLAEPFTAVLSRPLAEKYFPGENPVGKLLQLDKEYYLRITGVYEPLPAQSHFHPNMLISFATLADETIMGKEKLENNWSGNNFATYLLLPKGYDAGKLASRLPGFLAQHLGPGTHKRNNLYLQKLTDIHLHSRLDAELETNGNVAYVKLFALIGLLILLLAVINYMNLATARGAARAREVGVRKVLGAARRQLAAQFLSESLLLTVVAFCVAFALSGLLLPALNHFTGKSLRLNSLHNGSFLVAGLVLVGLTGLLSGSYPALFLSTFRPIKVLKGSIPTGGLSLRQGLVVVQFALTALLLIGTATVYRQLSYLQNKELGYRKDQVLILPSPGKEMYEAFRQELLAHPGIAGAGRSSQVPSGRLRDFKEARVLKGNTMSPAQVTVLALRVDHDFIPTYGMQMRAGRNFSRSYTTDDTAAYVLNETAVKLLGWQHPEQAVGQPFAYGDNRLNRKIIGVVKDFHFESLHQPIVPLVLYISPDWLRNVSVRLSGRNVREAIAHAERVWKQFRPEEPFQYQFLDEQFATLYQEEETRGQLFTLFTGVAILVACLGLFGLATYATSRRSKEIGIRKVLGASLPGIVVMLSREFVRLVGVAFLLAAPLAYYLVQRWLETYPYRAALSWPLFALAGGVMLLIALLTVGFQTLKAATANPVHSLRSE